MVGVFVLSIVAVGFGIISAAFWSASGGDQAMSAVFFALGVGVSWLAWRQRQTVRVAARGGVAAKSILHGLLEFLSERRAASVWGRKNPAIVCGQCQVRGHVRAKAVERKKGISGGKATGAILTSGLSLFFVGLSRKEEATQAHCENCSSTWHF